MTSFLIDHLIESTVFALAMGQLTLFFANNRASVRYGLWFAASVKFLIPFSAIAAAGRALRWETAPTVPLALPQLVSDALPTSVAEFVPETALPAATAIAGAALAPLARLPAAILPEAGGPSFEAILLGIWLLGCVFLLAHWMEQWWYLHRVRKSSAPAPIPAEIPVRFTHMLFEPGLVGIFRPVMLLPAGITAQLPPAQLALVIEHELCHWRRRDNLTAAIHMGVQLVFWFHPMLWWIGKCLVAERERACDESVLAASGDPKAYASSILEVCRFYVRSPLACAPGVAGANLTHRVERIMNNLTSARLSGPKLALLTTVAAGALLLPMASGLLSPEAVAAQPREAVAVEPRQNNLAQPLASPLLEAPIQAAPAVLPTPKPTPRKISAPARPATAPKAAPRPAPAAQSAPPPEVLMAANAPAPAPAKVAPPTAPMEEIVVTAKAIRDFVRTRNFVRQYTAPADFLDQISRWHEPLCVQVQGLAKGYNAYVTQRVKAVAAEIGAPKAESDTCRPNLSVFFRAQPQELLDYIKVKRPELLGPYYPAMREKLATVSYPVQAWYATGTRDRRGQRTLDNYGWDTIPGAGGLDGIDAPVYTVLGSHLRTDLTSEFASVIIVADIPRIEDWEIGTIADYIAMAALARAKTPDKCQQVPSITNVLGNCSEGLKAKTLSEFDTAYLKALYLSTPDAPRGLQESGISRAMLKILESKIAKK